jgi:hypothetical protein
MEVAEKVVVAVVGWAGRMRCYLGAHQPQLVNPCGKVSLTCASSLTTATTTAVTLEGPTAATALAGAASTATTAKAFAR